MGWLAILVAVVTCACGRVAFDPVGADAAGGIDVAPAVRCPIDATTIFCDDFELPDLSRWASTSGAVQLASWAHTGLGAAQVSIGGPPEASLLKARPAAIAQVQQLSVRAWVYVPAASSLGHVNFFSLVNGASAQEITVLWNQDNLDVYRRTSSTVGYTMNVVMQRDRWTCVELDVVVDDAAGSFELRADGMPIIQDSAIDTRATGDFDALHFGIPFSASPQGAATIYVDDFHLGTTAVGCG